VLLLLGALAGLACAGANGDIERHGSAGPGKNDAARKGEYGDDPGEADAKQDFSFVPPDDPDGGAGPADDAAADDAGSDGAAALPLEEVPARIAHLTCQRRLDCCLPAERSGLPDAPADCEQELTDELAPFFDGLARSVAAGRATYDGAALTRCLAAFQAAACPEARGWEALLAGARCAFVGATVAAGSDCRSSYECLDGFCLGVDQARDGHCVAPRLADGQPCDRGDDCASGACHPILDVCAPPEPGNLCD
jgi:hypothetical protein